MFSEGWLEEYGNTASQDRWSSPKLGCLMPARKERSVAGYHKQDQGSGQGGSLVALPGGDLKIMDDEDTNACCVQKRRYQCLQVENSTPGGDRSGTKRS